MRVSEVLQVQFPLASSYRLLGSQLRNPQRFIPPIVVMGKYESS
jgi:hypothetical protein